MHAIDEFNLLQEANRDSNFQELDDQKLICVKRQGVDNEGVEYETIMIALYALKLSLQENVSKIFIGTNLKGYGVFDDIVIRVEYEKARRPELHLVQLKNKAKDISMNEFYRKGDFWLKKYKDCYYEDIEKRLADADCFTEGVTENDVFMYLLTNIDTKGSSIFPLESHLVCSKFSHTYPDNFIATKSGGCYEFEIHNSFLKRSQFLLELVRGRNFYLEINKSIHKNHPQWAVGGEVTEIMNFFQGELIKKFQNGNDSYDSIIDQIPLELNKTNQANTMTLERYQKVKVVAAYIRKELKAALSIFNASPEEDDDYKSFVSNLFKTNQSLVEREIRYSDRDFFKNVSMDKFSEVISQYLNGTWSSKKGGNRANDSLLQNIKERIEKYIHYKYKLEKEAEYLVFFKRFLFCADQVDVEEAKAKIANLIQSSFGEDGYKMVEGFVNFVKSHFKPSTYAPLTKWDVKIKLLELLTGLTNPKQLREKYNVFKDITNMQDYFQKLEVLKTIKVSVQGRREVNLAEMTSRRFHNKISCTFLLRNIGRLLRVGSKDTNQTDVYIRRKFFKILLRKDVIYDTENNVFLFKTTSNNRDTIIGPSGRLSYYNFVKRSLLVTLGGRRISDAIEDVRVQKYRRNSPIHLVKEFRGKYLEWERSWGSVKDLGDFIVENENIDEDEVLQYFSADLNVVSAAQGMGKTTTLHVLANYCPPDVLVLKLDLNAHYKDLRENEQLKQNPLTYMWNLARSTATEMEMQIFEDDLFLYFLEANRLVVFIDAFDEIISENAVMETTFSIIEDLRIRKIKVWLFTRPLALPIIQNKYGILPISMAGFTEENIRFYLSKKLPVTQQTEVNRFLKGDSLTLYSVPHYLHMLVSICDQPVSLENMKVIDLYEQFVHMIFKKYHQVRGIDLQRNNININSLYEEYSNNHKYAALCVIFGAKYLIEKRILSEIELKHVLAKFGQCENNYGLVVTVRDGVPIFSHRTYAEYWTALWLLHNYTLCRKHASYNCIHLDKYRGMYEYLLDPQFKSVRLIFDMLVAEGKRVHSAVLEGDFTKVKMALTDFSNDMYVDKFGRTPLHLAMSYISKLDNESINIPKSIIKLLFEYAKTNNCCLHQADNLLGWNWYKYAEAIGIKNLHHDAAEWGIPEILKFLFEPKKRCFSKCNRKFLAAFFILKQLNRKQLKTRVKDEDSDSRTVLHISSLFGNTSCVQYLIKLGAEVNSSTKTQKTSMHFAAQKGHVDVLKILCAKGGIVNVSDKNKYTPLHLASLHGHVECAKYLIEMGGRTDSRTATFAETPIRIAVKEGDLSMVELLYAKMGHIDDVDEDRRTLLHAAVLSGRIECVRYLMYLGCDVNAKTKSGDTSLHLAAYQGYIEILKLLHGNGSEINETNSFGKTSLHEAILQGHIECVRYLAQVGADVNVKENMGYSPMHFAAYQEDVEFLKLLTQNGGDVNKANYEGYTPLHIVSVGARLESLKYLIEYGADINLRDEKRCTAMQLAALKGQVKSLKVLIESGADVNIRDSKGRTSLHAASLMGHIACVQYLIEADFFLDDTTNCEEKTTAICLAVKGGHTGVLKLLIEGGGDFYLTDSYGRTPLYLAVENGRTDCLRYLLDIGADDNLDVDSRRELIRLAAREGQTFTHKLLADTWINSIQQD